MNLGLGLLHDAWWRIALFLLIVSMIETCVIEPLSNAITSRWEIRRRPKNEPSEPFRQSLEQWERR